jgi:hypothetical protein
MTWSTSEIFRQFVEDTLENLVPFDLGSDVPKVALYDNSITPAQDVTAAASAYGGGVWVTTGGPTGPAQVFEAGQWAQGGVALAGFDINAATAGVVFYDANDTASAAAADLSNVTGCLVYDDTVTTPVADQGICYNYFSGQNSVVNGTFTVVWNANGIFRLTL